MNPSVAYDPGRDRYLIVFTYDYRGNASDWDIYGRFIPWNGPVAGSLDFSICDFISNQRRPVVAFASTQDEFLVTWINGPSGEPSYVSARRVYAGGGFPDTTFQVSKGIEDRDFPDVAYNLARNEYFITWDVVKSVTKVDIYGIRLTATGVSLTGGTPKVTGEFPIAGWPAIEEKPTVTTCSTFDQYLVAWQSDDETSGADYAIYARYLTGEAVPGNVYLVADTTSHQLNVDITCDGSGGKYLLAWQDRYVGGEYGISARHFLPDETRDPEFVIVGPRSLSDREYPSVEGGKVNFLAVWEHDRDVINNIDIYGKLIGHFCFLPSVQK
jgi:hypothetical protein